MKNPVTKQTKNVVMRNQSIFDKFFFSARVTTIKISKGPHAHHSPHIEAGDATLSNMDVKNEQ